MRVWRSVQSVGHNSAFSTDMRTVNKTGEDMRSLLDELFLDQPVRYTLPNGLKVLLKEDHSAKLVSAQVWVKTGSIHEGAFLGGGLSHFVEHMLFKGTKKRSGQDITREIQTVGGHINAYTSFDRTVIYIEAPSEAVKLAVDLLADTALDSVMPEDEVARDREVILREIDMSLDDPDRQVSRALFRNAFREHPYCQPVIGHREIFETITRDDLWQYYRARYAPNNITFIAVGDFDVESMRRDVDDKFGRFARRSLSPVCVPEEPGQLALREEHLCGDVQICRGGTAFKIPGLNHPDAPAMDILASILGSGHSSILWRRLREERKLVKDIDISIWNPGSSGLFWISYVCEPDKREAVQEALLEEIRRAAKSDLTAGRIKKAIRQAVVSEVNVRKTMGGQAVRLGLAEVVVGDLGYPQRYFQRIQDVEEKTLLRLINDYLVPDQMTAVSLSAPPQVKTAKVGGNHNKTPEDFELITLKNGARLLYQRDGRLPKVNLRVVSLGGPLYEDNRLRGITGLLATLLTKDTESRSASAIAESIEGVGGAFGEFAGNNTFGLSLEVLSQDFDLAVSLLEEALLAPAFLDEALDMEREAQIAQVKEDMDEIFDRGKKALRKRFFGDHPFRLDTYGEIDTMREITISDVRALNGKLLIGPNVVISLAGDFDPDHALPALQDLMNKLSDRKFERQDPSFAGPPKAGRFTETMQREQAVVFQAYPDPGFVKPDFYIAELVEEVLNDMSGRLFTKVREERSLAYFVGANRVIGLTSGMFYFYSGTHPASFEEVLAEFDAEVARLVAGQVTEEELHRCQVRLKVQKRMGLQTIAARAMQAALNAIYGEPINDWKRYDDHIDAVTPDELQRFACERFDPGKKVSLVIKP